MHTRDTNPAIERVKKIPVGVLGATGAVGQKFVLLLADHPWFELRELAASKRSEGRSYEEAVVWKQASPLPEKVRSLKVGRCEPGRESKIVFSGLDASVAGKIEERFAEEGCWVFSNAQNHRMEPDVPLVITELNADHFELVSFQRKKRGWPGAIVTNPNCSAVVLALSLGPLYRAFGLKEVQVVTLQAISGAGYPGLPSLDILGNVIPFISGEEEKIENETRKILGQSEKGVILPADFKISAQANRVPVEEGHLECVSLRFSQTTSPEEVVQCWQDFRGLSQNLDLPSAPEKPVVVVSEENRPQPRLDAWKYKGMSVLVGRVRPCSVLDIKYAVLGHNTLRGAAGASVLNAEYVVQKGMLNR